jgi:hypothetical protein
MTTELRIRSKIQEEELEAKKGKILTSDDYDVLLTRATRVLKPDGSLLCVYRPGAFPSIAEFYDVLHSLRVFQTTNRGMASGTERHPSMEGGKWTYSKAVSSAIIGSFDAKPPKLYCRLTAWTGRNWPEYSSLFPLFQSIAERFATEVPDRYAAQMAAVTQTPEDWVIEGTPFTTITCNNSYATGVHTDKGDLDAGFSNLTVLRRGDYSGGQLVFPEYRLAVDMQDGDLLLMDAHEWHGNVKLELGDPICWFCDAPASVWVSARPGAREVNRASSQPICGVHRGRWDELGTPPILAEWPIVPAERISIVAYFRTRMRDCGTPDQEVERAQAWAEHRTDITMQNVVEEMAAESAEVAGAS